MAKSKTEKFTRTFEASTQEELDRQIADAGRGAGQREYWASVKSLAQEAYDENPGDETAQDEHLWESVDGSSWIIYTAENLDVLRFTSHDDAWEEFGELDPSKALAQMAFAALRADALEELENIRREHADDEPAEE